MRYFTNKAYNTALLTLAVIVISSLPRKAIADTSNTQNNGSFLRKSSTDVANGKETK